MERDSKGRFVKGNKGGPGRAKRGTALSDLIKAAGSVTIDGPDGKRIASKRWMAQSIWSLITHGEVTLLDGKKLEVTSLEEWKQLVEWIITRVEGPPIERKEVMSEDMREIRVRFIPPGGEE